MEVMMKCRNVLTFDFRRIPAAVFALAAAVLLAWSPAKADAGYKSVINLKSSECKGYDPYQCIALKRQGYWFAFAVRVPDDGSPVLNTRYEISGRDSTNFVKLNDMDANVTYNEAGLFEFTQQQAGAALGMSQESLEASTGFILKVRLKYRVTGIVSRDWCPAFSFKFDKAKNVWKWARGSNPADSAFQTWGYRGTIVTRRGGTETDIQCRFEKVIDKNDRPS